MIGQNDGGLAFPVPPDARRMDIPAGGGMDGMSLRDWVRGANPGEGRNTASPWTWLFR